jgi:translation elongation factor EF-Tu-like GTPase
MDKCGESVKNKTRRTVDLESGLDHRLQRVSGIEIVRRLSNRGRAGENCHGLNRGRVVPSEEDRGKKQSD